jgi:glycerophosphoryl diester phosphodiesterase
VRVMSFSYVALQRMQRLAPDLRQVMLIDKARHWPVLKPVLEPGWILGPGIDALTRHPKFASKLADTGRDVHVWTVNTHQQLDLCLDLGVEAVITDRPREVLGWLGG